MTNKTKAKYQFRLDNSAAASKKDTWLEAATDVVKMGYAKWANESKTEIVPLIKGISIAKYDTGN